MPLLPKIMVVAYAVAALAMILELHYKKTSRTLHEDLNLVCSKLTIAAIHHKPIKEREVQMTRIKS